MPSREEHLGHRPAGDVVRLGRNLPALISHILSEPTAHVFVRSLTAHHRQGAQWLRVHVVRPGLVAGLHLLVDSLRGPLLAYEPRHTRAEPCVRDEADQCAPGEGNGAEPDGETPFFAVQAGDLESFAADEDDQNLTAHHDEVDNHEDVVASYAFEDVEFVVQSAVT